MMSLVGLRSCGSNHPADFPLLVILGTASSEFGQSPYTFTLKCPTLTRLQPGTKKHDSLRYLNHTDLWQQHVLLALATIHLLIFFHLYI